MTIQKLNAGRGAAWISDGIATIKSHSAPYLMACLLIGLISSLPLVGLLFGLLMPVFYGGLQSLLHRQAQGGSATAGQAFDGFQQDGAFARLLPIVLANLAFAVVVLIIIAVTVGVAVFQLIKSGQSQQPDAQMVLALLPKLVLVLLIVVPIGIFFGWVMMLAIPRAMLDQVPGMTAMSESVEAIFANLPAFLVNLVCLFLVMFVFILVLMIPMTVVGLLQQRAPFLGFFLQIPVMTVFTGFTLAFYNAVMYQAWREVFDGAGAAPEPPQDRIEV